MTIRFIAFRFFRGAGDSLLIVLNSKECTVFVFVLVFQKGLGRSKPFLENVKLIDVGSDRRASLLFILGVGLLRE